MNLHQPAAEWQREKWKMAFFTIWTGQALSLVGSRVAMFALIWWITDETGSATVLALTTLFAMLPQIVLGPFAGVFVDRWNRRVTMIVADSAIAAVSLWLAYLFWSGSIEVWHVYVIMLARELGGIFHWPAMQASTSLMVPKEHLARISGLNQAMQGALNIVGPALGALLLSVMEIHHIMLLDVITAAFAVGPLLVIAVPQPERKTNRDTATDQPSMWGELREAARYLANWRGLMLLTGMAMIVKIALTPTFSLLPLLVTDHFKGEAAELALFESLFGLGVITGGLMMGVWGGFKRNIYTLLVGVFMIGIAQALIGVTPAHALMVGVALMFFCGVAASLTDGPLFAIMQTTIAPEMQGRVFMLFGSLITLTSPLGLAIAGPVTDVIGIQTLYVISGVLMVVMGVAGSMVPAIMKIEDYDKGPVQISETALHPAGVEILASERAS